MAVYCICSVAQEPALEEWTCRVETSDLLHEPVSSQNLILIILSMIIGSSYIFIP